MLGVRRELEQPTRLNLITILGRGCVPFQDMAISHNINYNFIMNFTKVHNPTDTEVALQFLGSTYTIGGGKTVEFPEDVAKQWIYIYGFMSIVESKDEPKAVVEEAMNDKITKPKVAKKK